MSESTPVLPRVCVVIPAYGFAGSVSSAVRSLFKQDLPKDEYEIIVVDSTPDDSVAAAVTALIPDAPCSLRLLHKEPQGPGPSRDLGARSGRGEFIAFMDSDCVATPGWLRAGLAAFDDGVGLVQGRTLPDPSVPAGVFTWYVRIESETHMYEGANIFYRRAAFDQVGGISHDYNDPAPYLTKGGEDLDLGWRVKRAGWESRFCADALVYHEVQPIPKYRWLLHVRLMTFPLLARRFPELRAWFFLRYFYNRNQALVLLLLIGAALAAWHPGALLLGVPYLVTRASEPTRTLRGPLRLFRALAYLPQDIASFVILLLGSIRYRSLLL